MKTAKFYYFLLFFTFFQFSFCNINNNSLAIIQENLIQYIDKEIANTELNIEKNVNEKINLVQQDLSSQYSDFTNIYKLILIIAFSLFLALFIIIIILILNTYSLAKKTQRLYQTPQIFRPNYAITRQNPFYFITDGDIFKLLSVLDSWLDEDDYLKRIAVLMYYLPANLAQLLWDNLNKKNELINTLINLEGVTQEYVNELAKTIKDSLTNYIDKTDALGTVFDKLPEYHRNKLIKSMTEDNVLPKGYVLRFSDIFKQPKAVLKERINEIPTQTLALAMQTINKNQSKTIIDSLQVKKEKELKEYLKLLEDQKICQDNIDKAKEFIVKFFNYSA